ncbi:conserved hypothetical protein [Neospora caninum Liverpool]|uniref:Uncharacterized protein n=1 Tax=Neospora caninum (strain Liverpool) TaxID=572307 RepID=F0VRC2_NEOCL|nr:conserved hypothetical protein [Neospora caninum Liverpool]CBZ56270.1 conserved hypothetical protein [Neospora caninum Liverpool]CEL71033.1 TPA: hypothetical protein BN1204_066950 [Neospora caninum Liverpool]|eukprot:XP_003886295.1 conserved hypothetical protein [Neospora caninum Liverpool]
MARAVCGILFLVALSSAACQVVAGAESTTDYPNFLEALTRQSDVSTMMDRMAHAFFNAATQNEGVKMMERAIGSVVDPSAVQTLFAEANRNARSFLNPFEALWGMNQFQNRAVESTNTSESSVSEMTPQRVFPFPLGFPFFFPFSGASPAAKYGPRYEFHDHIYECGGRPCDESYSTSHSYSHSHSHSVSREE